MDPDAAIAIHTKCTITRPVQVVYTTSVKI